MADSVKRIGVQSFYRCTTISNITFSKSLVEIGIDSFIQCTGLNSVTLPARVSSILERAFADCVNLGAVFFVGNAPTGDPTAFEGDNNTTVYYLSGTTGWGATYLGRPAVLWNPQAQMDADTFGVRSNQFGFTIVGPNDATIVVEATTDLARSNWSPVGTNILNGGTSHFSDPKWTNYPSRFYRFRSP
jgi:hypothetical protein